MRQLSSNGSDWLEPYRRYPVRHRLIHPDGHAYDTWLIEARDAPRPGPVVIQIHGGFSCDNASTQGGVWDGKRGDGIPAFTCGAQ